LHLKKGTANIKAITHYYYYYYYYYYTIASIACPGKHDVYNNPDDRSEREGKRLLFGSYIHTHHCGHYGCLVSKARPGGAA
jgi:hypothetical protein